MQVFRHLLRKNHLIPYQIHEILPDIVYLLDTPRLDPFVHQLVL